MIRGVIDLHAHVLPGLDDGPASLDEAAEMAAAAVAQGTRVMAATSHINRGFGLQPAELGAARAGLRERLATDGIGLDVVQGGEIALSRAPELTDDELHGLTLGGSRWLLLECPLSPRSAFMDPVVTDLRSRGFEILLAHPERSPTFMRQPGPLEQLIGIGALAQVTASAFTGDFGDIVRRAAFSMLERGLVHVLASDGHSPDHRPPDLRGALGVLERRYDDGAEQFEWMAAHAPGALLAGEPLPPRPAAPKPRGLLRRFRA